MGAGLKEPHWHFWVLELSHFLLCSRTLVWCKMEVSLGLRVWTLVCSYQEGLVLLLLINFFFVSMIHLGVGHLLVVRHGDRVTQE